MHSESSNQNDSSFSVEQAIANLQGDDLGLRVYAAWWLGRFRVSSPEIIRLLLVALQDDEDRTESGGYPLRRNAARALGKLGEPQAVPLLIRALDCSDFYVREAAAQSLELLGDSSCIPKLIELLQDQVSQATPAPQKQQQLAQPYDAILEALGTLGATEIIPLIRPFIDHPTPRVRFAAARAMCQLSPDPQSVRHHGDILVQGLLSDDLQLRRAVLADLGAIGYLPAAEAIGNTLAENSLKLIALKGLLEKELSQSTVPYVSAEAMKVMVLMDDLL
jgi:phycocyanobilin lyase alpha subunit